MLKAESINQTLRAPHGITDIRAEGSFLILTYGGFHDDVEVYLNNQGREVLKVTRPHQVLLPSRTASVWKRLFRS
jgi:hypothetical protein